MLKATSLKKLNVSFYDRPQVATIARELLGKILVTQFRGSRCSGRIVETEAYEGVIDQASHAYGGRRTARTEVMYQEPARAYVYLCYGIHHLFNVVTASKEQPHAVLIRALEPLEGMDTMARRASKRKGDLTLTRGPGNLTLAMGISLRHSGYSLLEDQIYIATDGFRPEPALILASPRIGVGYAAAHAAWLFRFYLAGNKYVSARTKRP